MDPFTYSNIFDTKGIEYIAIISFLLLLIPFWIFLNKKVTSLKNSWHRNGILSPANLRIPQGLYFCNNHTWAHLEKSGTARVGIDEMLLHITGEINLRFQKNPGEVIRKGEVLTEVDQHGKKLKVFSPISGKIVNANQSLTENPEIMDEDPYGQGWIYKIKPFDWKGETESYFLAEDATKWSMQEVSRFKDFFASEMEKFSTGSLNPVLQDGGELRDNTLSELPAEIWEDFQKSFLNIGA
ncbi:MAG: hypothetical protein H6538_01470 [Bacteroidales bacterium]|nr:hypothetical protein [Bacteroidales bacterium]MCB9013536.1 hypothetical protein [Bacteroidales bacterium]